MNVLLFYNPKAGTRTFQDDLDLIIEAFQNNGDQIIPHRLKNNELLEDFLKRTDMETISKILIAGGDGTIHQVVNMMMKLSLDKPIGIFPVGTANDFAQYFEMPKDIEGMIKVALRDTTVKCDIGKANDRYFINVASFGNLVDISQRVNEQAKNVLGVLAYYIKGIEEFPRLKSVQARFEMDNEIIDEEIFFALVMNGKSAGAFRKLSPYSEINDGMLDVLIFKKCPMYEIVPLLMQVWNGEHPKSNAIHYSKTQKVHIECVNPLISDLDGETGPELPLDIEVIKGRLEIIK
ncbi:MAG: YegS/Rv2252/BmrU family lipid kinase [Clostridiales bacterium]|nr:YegS/Rv2252/BmrU family lipid kinase [Clostridiales bacterium]